MPTPLSTLSRAREVATLRNALEFSRAVALVGPRQCGKSTLARAYFSGLSGAHVYLDLERPQDLAELSDPEAFFAANSGSLICIDEIQRAPDLFPVLRYVIDKHDTPGQFLTRHKDDITAEGRRIAYVMGFSKDWHPDWAGLLNFYEDDGSGRDFWIPAFNSLSLFDVRHVHSVSYVTPFAKQQRLSLTGWFCA